MCGYPINYDLRVMVFEPYKKQWMERTENLGRCMSKDEAITKAFTQLVTLGFENWKNFIVTNEKNKVVYSCPNNNKVN